MNKIINDQDGQTIIEAVVALVALLLIITAISTLIVNGLYNSSHVKSQNEANKYAQQGIETVRNIQKNNLSIFKGYVDAGGFFCINDRDSTLFDQASGCSDTGINTGTSYNRTVVFSQNDAACNNNNPSPDPDTNELLVKVTVKWSSSKCSEDNRYCNKSELETCMPYIYPGSNP